MRRAGLLALLLIARLGALDPGTALHHYSHRVWTDRDGLPRNTITALAQTSDGYLWIAMEEGLARFDGLKFSVYDSQSTPPLRVPTITTLAATRDGALWIGTRGGGLLRHQAGQFERFGSEHGLTDNLVRCLLEDRAGRLWIGTQRGISIRESGAFRPFPGNGALPDQTILALHQDRSGILWAGTSTGVARIEGELVRPFLIRWGQSAVPVRAIRQDAQGGIWAGTEGRGVFRHQGAGFVPLASGPLAEQEVIRALLTDQDANLWVGGSRLGLRRLSKPADSFESGVADLSGSIIRCLLEDSESNLWVGTEGAGLHRLSDPRIITYSASDGLSSSFVRPILEDRKGTIWIGTEGGGLNRFHNGRIEPFPSRGQLGSENISVLFEDSAGTVWVAAEDGGLGRIRNGVLKNVAIAGLGATQSVWAIAEDPGGGLWLASGGQVRLVRGGVVHSSLKLPWDRPRVLHTARNGELWVGFRDGAVAVRRGDAMRTYSRQPGMLDAAISSIHEDREGRIWITTAAGLMLFRNGAFSAFTRKHGLFHDKLLGVLDDGLGKLWLTSSRGVFATPISDLLEVAGGRRSSIRAESFTTADGMRTNECTGDSHPALMRARDGSLWFPTVQGVSVLNPQLYRVRESPIAIHIVEVRADGAELPLDRLAELPAGTNELLFRYSAPHFLAPEKLRFQYRLDGAGQAWRDAGERREVALAVPERGAYRFQVRLAGAESPGGTPAASFPLSVAPHFYRTGWFYALLLSAAGAVAFAVHRYHLHEVRARFNAVLAERTRVAREIHDTLLQGFTGTALEIDAVSQMMLESPREAQARLNRSLERIDGCLTEARESILELRHRPLDARDLPSAVSTMVERLAADAKAEVRLDLFGRARPVPDGVERNLLAILREALSNSLRYSGASVVRVELHFTKDALSLRVRDDGRGLPTSTPEGEGSTHFGLVGMQERAAVVGGHVDIRSCQGSGTEVLLSVPIPRGIAGSADSASKAEGI